MYFLLEAMQEARIHTPWPVANNLVSNLTQTWFNANHSSPTPRGICPLTYLFTFPDLDHISLFVIRILVENWCCYWKYYLTDIPTMSPNIAIYKDTVPWPLYICTFTTWTSMCCVHKLIPTILCYLICLANINELCP